MLITLFLVFFLTHFVHGYPPLVTARSFFLSVSFCPGTDISATMIVCMTANLSSGQVFSPFGGDHGSWSPNAGLNKGLGFWGFSDTDFDLTSVSETIRKPPLVKAQTALKNKKIN